MQKKAIVLIAGGLDSATCLAIAKSQGFICYALSFDYGQRHLIELQAAERVANILGVAAHRIVKLDIGGQLGGSALTDHTLLVPDYSNDGKIPITYVPARNTIFLSIALSWAETLDAHDIFIGCSLADYSGYPDCRAEYIEAFTKLANLATKAGVEGNPFQLHTPLMKLTKAETILTGLELGIDYSLTITCYQPDSKGRACGHCISCVPRREGFAAAGVADPTRYVN
jgi:7-cyano-7-deazaguanine synthase